MKYRWRSYAAAFVGISLVFALGTRGVVQSLTGPGDVGLTTDSSHYSVGDTIIFSGNLDFAIGEVATTTLVLLDLSGPQTMTTGIPMLAGSHDLSNRASVPGQLQVDVTFVDIWDFGGGTKAFKGLAAGARIFIHAAWTPDQVSASSGAYRASLSADMEGERPYRLPVLKRSSRSLQTQHPLQVKAEPLRLLPEPPRALQGQHEHQRL
ncbi:MAG: hypothetical protein O3A33_03730 [Chloroflexi bacterium]|nr:hypothetical protein [Chloroflexota bacterium]